MKRWKYTSLQ